MNEQVLFTKKGLRESLGISRTTYKEWKQAGKLPTPTLTPNDGLNQTIDLFTLDQIEALRGQMRNR